MRQGEAVGIMGGTFDPIHYGHLVIAEGARVEYDLSEVIFIPSGMPPHKRDQTISNAEDRYRMTMLATQDNPHFSVSRVEIDRPGPSFAVDTIRTMKEMYGPDVDLYFITGADAILQILSWKDVGSLISMCHFVAATRPGYSLTWLREIIARIRERHQSDFSVQYMEVPGLMISSTDIRQRVRSGLPIRYLLPEIVESYIRTHRLYLPAAL
jgi:nicotinate-nucleotide adenylyltransferase